MLILEQMFIYWFCSHQFLRNLFVLLLFFFFLPARGGVRAQTPNCQLGAHKRVRQLKKELEDFVAEMDSRFGGRGITIERERERELERGRECVWMCVNVQSILG